MSGDTTKPIFQATPFDGPASVAIFEKGMLVSNQAWLEPVFEKPQFRYSINRPPPRQDPVPAVYNNDYYLTEDDKTTLVERLADATIVQFLKRTTIHIDELVAFDFKPISYVSEGGSECKMISMPGPLNEMARVLLSVEITSMSIPVSGTPLSSCTGFVFLYSVPRKMFVSDAVYFRFDRDGKLQFAHNSKNQAFFELREMKTDGIVVVAVLANQDPMFVVNDFKQSGEWSVSGVEFPFAFSYFDPHAEKPEQGFVFPWTGISSSDSCKGMAGQVQEAETVPIMSKVSVKVITEDELPKCCWISEQNEGPTEILFRSIPQKLIDPEVSLVLSGFQFQLSSANKGEFVFFKLFICNTQTDPLSPNGMPLIVDRCSGTLKREYNSNAMPSGKKVYFADIVRIVLKGQLDKTAHLIIHVMTVARNEKNLTKICVVPLFPDGTLIQTRVVTGHIQAIKKLKPEDYLTKLKSSTKATITFVLDIPYGYFPPKPFEEFAEAMVPQQVKWDLIVQQTPVEILAELVLPISAKLFSIISPTTAEEFLNLLTELKPCHIISKLRSWLYSGFDPKKIKHNFISSFTNSFDQILQSALDDNSTLLYDFIDSFDIISDVLLISFNRRTEEWIPASIFSLFARVTSTVKYFITKNEKQPAVKLNQQYGMFMFLFRTICDDERVEIAIKSHIRALLALECASALSCIFEFVLSFTETDEFALYCAKKLPVKPLNSIMFSPFQPIISLLCLSASKALNSSDELAISNCVELIRRLLLPLEDVGHTLSYRAGFAFFPFLDIISTNYESQLSPEEQFKLIPAILFLITYTPAQLLKNFFGSIPPNFQVQFIEFLTKVTEVCMEKMLPEEMTIVNGLFDQLTQRFLQFLYFNLNNLGDALHPVVKLVSLMSCPFQNPHNYPRMFDIVSRLIKLYPCQRLLVSNLLEVVMRKQHIARCYATSLIILFFKADFDERKTVVVSSVEVLDALTSLLLHSPIEQIAMYKKMIERIKTLIVFFNCETLTSKLGERMVAATNIADVIEKLRLAAHPPDERCAYVMQIANQYKTFPSMRMKWLKEIVRINVLNKTYAAAFVAQLHICALVATVINHEQSMTANCHELTEQFNLLICQPIRNGRTTGGCKYVLSSRDFSFFPSVLVETKIDFDSISSDFQFISSDFNMTLLKESMSDAISYGLESKLFYSVRCVMGLMMRIYGTERAYKELADLSAQLQNIFSSLTVSTTTTHDTELSFYVYNKRVYCVDSLNEEEFLRDKEVIKVNKLDKESGELEHLHSWSIFRNIVPYDDLRSVASSESPEVVLVQFTTKDALPRYTTFAEIAERKEVHISLSDFVALEAEKVMCAMRQSSLEFEKCFPCRNIAPICGTFEQNLERDMDRLVALFRLALDGKQSLFELMKLQVEKGGEKLALELAIQVRVELERLIKVYHRGIEYLQSQQHFLLYKEMRDLVLAFTTEFKLQEINAKSYEGRGDPLTEHIEYEVT